MKKELLFGMTKEELEATGKNILVRYADLSKKVFSVYDWLLFRDGIKENCRYFIVRLTKQAPK